MTPAPLPTVRVLHGYALWTVGDEPMRDPMRWIFSAAMAWGEYFGQALGLIDPELAAQTR